MMLDQRTPPRPLDIDVIPAPSHPNKSTKVANAIAAISLTLVAIALLIFLKWSVADTNVLQVNNSPFPARVVSDPSGQTGGIVFLKADYCKNADNIGEIRMSYVSKSREIFLPLQKERLPAGCHNEEIPVVIPLNLLQDQYKIKFRVTYDINPVKKDVTTYFESQEITVGTNNVE